MENLNVIKNYLSDSTDVNADGIYQIATNSLNEEELFLTNGFKLLYSQNLVKSYMDGLQISLWLFAEQIHYS